MSEGFIPVKDWVKRTPGPDDIEKGKLVAEELKDLNAKDVLIRAAMAGYVSERRYRMTFCFCPLGDTKFLPRAGTQLSPWIPTHEHYPTSARNKGTHRLDNVVLARRRRRPSHILWNGPWRLQKIDAELSAKRPEVGRPSVAG